MTVPATTPLYVDVHVLQTVPPSNLNRDDAGSPKQAVYGGVRRARVSSQAWKRAARSQFVSLLPADRLATRTKKITSLVADRLAKQTDLPVEEATRIATRLLQPLGITPGRKAAETAYLLFLGRAQLDAITALVAGRVGELAAMTDEELDAAVKDLPVREHLSRGHPVDVALFGRMVADIPSLNVDAATQVAHALSTHPVDIEFDYFTAVDDENPREDTGAGMIGTVEFNSATLYRFATVGVHQLLDNLDKDADATLHALHAFVTAFVRSMPTGHQNSFAHRTVPHLVAVAVRDNQPVNLVSAFESPVHPNAGLAGESARRLAAESRQATDVWALTPLTFAASYPADLDSDGVLAAAFGAPVAFPDLVTTTVDTVRSQLPAGS